ncbi:MAG: FAD-dependent oxidoreductase [Ilumatobacteraceae bacterium]
MAERCDVAVVGLGLVGAAALRHLAGSGLGAVGIGPSEPVDFAAHDGVFASHYDSGRITRRLDKRREWAILAERAIYQYPLIAAASGIEFHQPVGVVMADVDADRLSTVTGVADRLGVGYARYAPGQPFGDDRISVPDGATVLHEPAPGGFIDPRRMLSAQLAVARQGGAETIEKEVTGIARSGTGWSVTVSDGSTVEAAQVVIATGPHADELHGLPSRPLIDVVAETVVMARVSALDRLSLSGLPAIIIDGAVDHLYIVPPTKYPDGEVYVKLGATRHEHSVLSAGGRRAWMAGSSHEADLDWLRGLLEGVLPGLRADQWLTKPCLIPDTPTKLPYLEIVEPGLVMAVGSNGYAAKSADAIGALAAGLVVNGHWTDPDLDARDFELIARD